MRKILATTLFALLLASNAAAAADSAAVADVGDVPVVVGHPEGGPVKVPEIDTAAIEPRGAEPLTGGRPDAPHLESAPRTRILEITVEGNHEVVADHILSVISSKVGSPMDQNRLSRDADEIFELGFFTNVDYRIIDDVDGARVVFLVNEYPTLSEINFYGNTTFTSDQLREICFTQPGMIFNRVFFRNDLQRIREKYQQDGFVMARIADVRVEGTSANVFITEPEVGEIIIQGNKRTKTYVISRQIRLKEGDKFNATLLRHSLSRLQGMGYFEDVSVGFENTDTPDKINVVLTVVEAKTGRIGISVGYGTQSGFSGGLSYSDSNWGGRGESFGIGFDVGNREQYWLTLEQPYMDDRAFSWRVGAYKRAWSKLKYYDENEYQFDYDEDRIGAYVGIGRLFARESKYSWFFNTQWEDVDISVRDGVVPTPQQQERMENGTVFNLNLRLTRNNLDPYSSYSKGDTESITVEKGLKGIGDWDYWKYWIEAKYYTPLNFLTDIFERNFTIEDVPPIFAARVMYGDSHGYLPWAAGYTLGGDSTLRGYRDKRFRGDQIFVGNAELRLPVHRVASIVFFYDIGRVWDTYHGESFKFSELAKAYGMGVRLITPVGNLRFDFARGDDESRVHFGFGELF